MVALVTLSPPLETADGTTDPIAVVMANEAARAITHARVSDTAMKMEGCRNGFVCFMLLASRATAKMSSDRGINPWYSGLIDPDHRQFPTLKLRWPT